MPRTTAERIARAEAELTTVEAAIDIATKSVSYTVGGGDHSVQHQRLEELHAREAQLNARIDQLTRKQSGRPKFQSAAFQ